MNLRFYLGAYWKARKESIEQCADRLHRMFSALSICDESLVNWYELGHSRRQALEKQADVSSRKYLLNLLNRGHNRRDTDKSVIEELGFHVNLWNGAEDSKAASLSVTCGLYITNPNLCNSIVLDFPEKLGELSQSKRMAAVLTSVATAWEPDRSGVMSDQATDTRKFEADVPFIDWMLYLSNRIFPSLPPMPPPTIVQQIDCLGSLIVIQDEPPDPTNIEHMKNIERVESILNPIIRDYSEGILRERELFLKDYVSPSILDNKTDEPT
jgi:hypothetical protein